MIDDSRERPAAQLQRTAGRPAQVDVASIVDAALEIGLDSVTLPEVARRLRVGVATVYRHVAGLDELRRGVLARLISEAAWPDSSLRWDDYLRGLAAGVAQVLSRDPATGRFCEPVAFGHPDLQSVFESSVAELQSQGFSREDAVLAVDLVMHVAFYTASDSRRPATSVAHDELPAIDVTLRDRIDVIVSGLAVRRSAGR